MERIICPNCKRKLRNINAWHYCKEVAIDDLFLHKSDEIVLAFDRILQEISEWKDVEISATKNCIVFVRNKTFLVLKPMTKYLEAKFYSEQIFDDETLYKCEKWNSKYQGVMRFANENQISSAFFRYCKDSYQIS